MTAKTLFRWHVWLGVGSGLFMLVIGLSGAVAVFIEEIDWLVTPPLRVSGGSAAPRAGPDAVLDSVRAAYPEDRITVLQLSERPRFAHVAKVRSRSRGTLDVFVDPVSARVTGDREYTGDYTSTLRNFIRQLHLRLFLGLWGRVFVGVFGVTLVLSCVTGLWIYRGWFKSLFRLRWRSAGPRTRWSDLHKFVGVWSLLFNILIGVTGAVFGLENLTGQIRSKWFRDSRENGSITRKASASKATASGPGLSMEALLERSRQAFPELSIRTITLPPQPGGPVVFHGDVPHVLVQQSHVRRANSLSLDSVTGEVLRKSDGREAKGWSRIYSSFDPLHFGYFGGIPTKIVWFVLGMAPSVLSLSGAWLWWRRTRMTRSRPPPSAERPRSGSTSLVIWGSVLLTVIGTYVLLARAHGSWAWSGKLLEHGLAKPAALALVAFPISGLLGWFAWRMRTQRTPFSIALGLCAAWYLCLVSLFQ